MNEAAVRELFTKGTLSDATLILTVPGCGDQEQSSSTAVSIPVHRFCLAAASEYFKSKLDRWTASIDAPSNMEIVEICEPDEVEAASAVVKVIYHGKVCDHPPAMQAVQMLKIAGRWLAPDCMQYCLHYLATLPDEDLDATILPAVLQAFPHGIYQLCDVAAWSQRCTTIASSVSGNTPDRLPLVLQVLQMLSAVGGSCLPVMLNVFGNLPTLLSKADLLDAFKLVPFTAVSAWASSDQLQVDSENSVAVALDVWCKGPQGSQCTADQLKELAGMVRVCQCSSAYLLYVLPSLEYFKPLQDSLRLVSVPILEKCDLPEAARMITPQAGNFPAAWISQVRRQPVGTSVSCEIKWNVPKQQLEAAILSPERALLHSSPVYGHGTGFQLQLILPKCAKPGMPRDMGAYLRPCDFSVAGRIIADKASQVACSFKISCEGRPECASEEVVWLTNAWGWPGFFKDISNMASLRPSMTGDSLVIIAQVQFKQ